MKDIRSCGANLSKLWAVLARLRDILGRDAFPDPYPAPRSDFDQLQDQEGDRRGCPVEQRHDERGARGVEERGGALGATAESVASDATGGKEATLKAAWQEHKQHLQKLDGMTKILSHAYTPRSGYLGQDAEGRTYWALSLACRSGKKHLRSLRLAKRWKARGRRRKGEGVCRVSLTARSWKTGLGSSQCGVVSREMLVQSPSPTMKDAWWGIWEPAEIRNYRSGSLSSIDSTKRMRPCCQRYLVGREDQKTIKTNSLPSKHELESLVKGLDEYATVLQWRIEKAATKLEARFALKVG
ncbi:hypothetical protein IMY05_C4398000800 [Salix suchowensis]|nr:hypothetical protein IMY05_C4398000800 [Salix suchowensis]